MQGNALARATILPALIAGSVAVGWSLWPIERAVTIDIGGLPAWGFAEVKLARQVAVPDESGLFAVSIKTGDRTLRVQGGVGEAEHCDRCCWSLKQDIEITRDTSTLTLNASVPDCPTEALGYTTREVGLGEVTIGGQTARLRRAIFVGEPVSLALWQRVSADGCGDIAVGCVTWIEAIRFANALSETEGLTPAYYYDDAHLFPYGRRDGDVRWRRDADGWRLPTEAEWVHAVGSAPGWEWVWDRFTDPYSDVVRSQPMQGLRTVRGLERSSREASGEDLGFRLVRDVPPTPEDTEDVVRPLRERSG